MTLYIIGNGFDLHHNLDTWYSSFGRFLRDHYSEQYDNLIKYYYLPEIDDDEKDKELKDAVDKEWGTFEDRLADVDSEEIMEEYKNYIPDIASDDYNSEIHSYGQEIAGKVKELTDKLFHAFREFIMQVQFPANIDTDKIAIEADSIFLSFNYTNTLQRYYNIPQDRIKYIHGNANNLTQVLVLGHGRINTPANDPPPTMPSGLTEEEEDYWRDQQSNNYDYSYESGKEEMNTYFNKTFKNSSKIIVENQPFFESLKNVDKVIVLGHSLAAVDSEYFKTIISVINNSDVIWEVSCRKEHEKPEKKIKMMGFGLIEKQLSLINMNELLLINQ